MYECVWFVQGTTGVFTLLLSSQKWWGARWFQFMCGFPLRSLSVNVSSSARDYHPCVNDLYVP